MTLMLIYLDDFRVCCNKNLKLRIFRSYIIVCLLGFLILENVEKFGSLNSYHGRDFISILTHEKVEMKNAMPILTPYMVKIRNLEPSLTT